MLESLFVKVKLYEKETPTEVFSREYFEIFKYTFFPKHLRTTASIPCFPAEITCQKLYLEYLHSHTLQLKTVPFKKTSYQLTQGLIKL